MFTLTKMKIFLFLNMKNSFSLFELLLTLIISSTIIIFSSKYLKEIYLENQNIQNIEISKIDLRSTKIFLEKNIKDLDKLTFTNNNLYFKNYILLEKVNEFKLIKNSDHIEIFINYDNKITQIWKIVL
jgi:type II secretory pathway component PulJ